MVFLLRDKFLNTFELLILLVKKELKIRYAYSVLGYTWTLLIPLAFVLTYFIAFSIVMRIQMQHYIPFLVANIFPWFWFVNSLIQATCVYRQNASLVKKVNISRWVLPTSIVAKETMHFIFALPIVIVVMAFGMKTFYWSWLFYVPMMLILQFVFISSLANILALFHVFIRDIEYLISIAMNVIFFMTPIVYPLSMVPQKYKIIFFLNPFASFIVSWNSIWLKGGNGDEHLFFICFVIAFVTCGLSIFTYRRLSKYVGELI
ncbi:MAG: hypothetical protein A2X78_02990 [Gammaproteobacteria bacterium GWE2_37_16]|nr:MAG: hypothetical protein A2X78_02990 [Gammaproteobacteria bacterium GWE2_37_16]